jgi:polyhydroxyalkanoate synthesis regulator phasin
MARGDYENLASRIRQLSEEGLTSLFNEVMTNERMRKGLGRAGARFMENKQSFDRNIEQMLEFFNVPSRRDVRDLKSRLDHLSSQLLNLSIKVDRLAERDEQREAPATPRPKAARKPRKST